MGGKCGKGKEVDCNRETNQVAYMHQLYRPQRGLSKGQFPTAMHRPASKCNDGSQIFNLPQCFLGVQLDIHDFSDLQEHVGQAPIISKPKTGEPFNVYLAISLSAISSVLIQCII